MSDNNKNNEYDVQKAESLRSELLNSVQKSDTIKEFKVTPEELMSTLNFMKSRIADLTFEVALTETKFKKLAIYCQHLEEQLDIKNSDLLTDLAHPDA